MTACLLFLITVHLNFHVLQLTPEPHSATLTGNLKLKLISIYGTTTFLKKILSASKTMNFREFCYRYTYNYLLPMCMLQLLIRSIVGFRCIHWNSLDTVLPEKSRSTQFKFKYILNTTSETHCSWQLKEIYCVTTSLPSLIRLIYFPWGVSDCREVLQLLHLY